MKTCIIVIPIYKESPSTSERKSFEQVLKILDKYDIVIITHKKLTLDCYYEIVHRYKKDVHIEYFEKAFFTSIQGYNSLCLSTKFYNRFKNYEYMLIYQLDAWIFKDELEYWCKKGYDYLGAPVYINNIFLGVGNGGLSLRRNQYCLNILERKHKKMPFFKPSAFIKLYCSKYKFNIKTYLYFYFKIIIRSLGFHNNLKYFISGDNINEDYIFGILANDSWGIKANIPSLEEAARFSFESHPSDLYKKLGNRLPFGCHAFYKWDYDSFWMEYIPIKK